MAVHPLTQPRLCANGRIRCRNFEALGQEVRGPACANDAGADDGNLDSRVSHDLESCRETEEAERECQSSDENPEVLTIGPQRPNSL